MNGKTILVVDDEASIRSLLKQALGRTGCRVQTAENAETALEMIEKEPVFVYFLDLNLPGMNGIELCRAIKKRIPMAILYAITGYASLFELSECREAGFEDYFKKPCNLKTLAAASDSAFEKLARWKQT